MAFPCGFEGENCVLGKPREVGGTNVEALSVLKTTLRSSGLDCVISCFKVTAEELAEITKTGRIWVTVLGKTMPPIAIDGLKPFGGSVDAN